jgi:hypothetical protein
MLFGFEVTGDKIGSIKMVDGKDVSLIHGFRVCVEECYQKLGSTIRALYLEPFTTWNLTSSDTRRGQNQATIKAYLNDLLQKFITWR